MDVDALKAAPKVGDVTAVREWLNIDQADPLAGIVRVLRALCGGDGWHQRLRHREEDILAWSPDVEDFIRGIDSVANTVELTAEAFVLVTNAVEARLGARRAKEAYEFNTRQRAERSHCVKRMPEHPAPPRVFCWGPLEDVDAELAAIDQALWRGQGFIKQARRDAADAVDAGSDGAEALQRPRLRLHGWLQRRFACCRPEQVGKRYRGVIESDFQFAAVPPPLAFAQRHRGPSGCKAHFCVGDTGPPLVDDTLHLLLQLLQLAQADVVVLSGGDTAEAALTVLR